MRLGLALNHSVFEYEVMQDKVKAFSLAETALQTAVNKVDDVKEEDY